ncbi:MAG TPA: hypothetical protein VGM90_05520 [Kofleriaceae bacterium]
MAAFARFAISCSLVLVACGPSAITNGDGGADDDDGGHTGPHQLSATEISPLNPIVELDLNEAGSQGFTVTGHYLDGVDEDLTTQVTWSVENAAVGAFNTGSTLDIPARPATAVDVSKIHAELNGVGTAEAQITVVSYRRTGAATDFFFVLPYNDSAGQAMKPLEFGTAVPALDVFFTMDTTFSMSGEITNLKNSVANTIIPGIKAAVADTHFGIASFQDFPVSSYGAAGDQPTVFLSALTNDAAAVSAAVGTLSLGNGNDIPEAGMEAIYQALTGEGLSAPSPTSVPATALGYRSTAMPVIVEITDALWHEPGGTRNCLGNSTEYSAATTAHTRTQVKAALAAKCARTVGIATDAGHGVACGAQQDLEDFATTTGARVPPAAWDVGTRPAGCGATQCCTGPAGAGRATDGAGLCPLVYLTDSNGTGLGASVVTGIQMLARFAAFDVLANRGGVATDIAGVALPTPHTTADFIKEITPVAFTLPAAPPIVPSPTFDATTFHGVTPGTKVKFNVNAYNDFLPQTANAQIFKATITVTAGGCTPLDSRDVLILVPPTAIQIGRFH